MKERSKTESNFWRFNLGVKLVGDFILPVTQPSLNIGDVVNFGGKNYKITNKCFYISNVTYNEWSYTVEEVNKLMLVPTPEMLQQALEIINQFSPIQEGDVINNLPQGKINFSNGGRLLYSSSKGFRFEFVPFDLVEGKGFVRYFPDEQTLFYYEVVYMINNGFLNKQLSW